MSLTDIVLAITLLLMTSAVIIPIARWLGIGPELGLLLSGIVLGSSGMLSPSQVESAQEISQLGVVFLLFIIGLELDLQKAWSVRRYALGLGALQVAVTGLVLMLYWRVFASSWSLGLLLGLVLSNSSTALVLEILERKRELNQEHGQAAFAVLLFQDVTVVPIMALIPVFAGTGMVDSLSGDTVLLAIGVMAIVLTIGNKLCPWLLRLASRHNLNETFTAVVFVAVLGSAWLASHVGVSMAIGAFLMGVALSSIEYRNQLREQVMPFKNLLVGLFFVSVGLTIDITVLSRYPERILLHVLTVVAVKVIVLYSLARALRMGHGSAARLSFLLGQAGEFGFVVLGALLASGVVTSTQFANGIMVIGLTTILTPWLDGIGILWSRWDSPFIPNRKAFSPE